VWGASDAIKGDWYLGLFGVYERDPGSRVKGHAVSVRGLAAWMAGLAVVGYLAAATALFWFWQRNPYSVLSYADALLRPVRGAVVHDKQGQAFIAQGTDALREKKWAEGVSLLRQGLAYHPGDLRARLTLAQFYFAINQRPAALKLLKEGLGREFPGRAYLQTLIDVAEQGEDYDFVVQLCDRQLPLLKGDAALRDRRWLLGRKFAALLAGRHFADMLALTDAEPPGAVTNENRVLALLGLGRTAEAAKFLAEWRGRPGTDAQQVLRLQVRTFREARQFDEMDRALAEFRAASPADPRTVVYSIVQSALAGRDEAAKKALDDYLFRFGGAKENLLLLAEPLAEVGSVPLLERCVAAAAERGYPASPFQVLLVQAQVQRGDWPAAARGLALMPAPAGRDAAQVKMWRDWMQRLVDTAAAQNDAAPLALVEFLRSRPWPMRMFRQSIAALRLAGRWETARDVIALAAGAFPASAWLQAQRDEVAGEIAARQPAPETAAAATRLPGEKIYFQQLAELLRTSQWEPAEQLMRAARGAKPAPAWLAARDADLRFAQMQISQARGERPEMLAAATLYLNGDNDRSQKVLEMGRAAFAAGDKDSAIALAKEVLRRSPDFPPAQRLLNEWQPKSPRKK
jgi:tetratricopeptide (TPR) repeat protein